ncbi:MAG: poly(R)-hydroxyalkanoic acid synthase subunit, partial [Halobacteriales archaeon]|nr:poly(R)-hydroxyalkanoic acid synthase subunit [Halobacteriales archaeon]
MSDPKGQDAESPPWSAFVDELNASLAASIEDNMAAQEEFAEAWFDALDDSGVTATETHIDGMQAYIRGLETWMQAIEEQYRLAINALEGEDVQPEEFRDIWLNAANQAFKEVMRSSAFAATTGEAIDNALEYQR